MRKLLMILITILFVYACSDDELQIIEPINSVNSEVINVTGMLQGVNNWTSNNIYVLNQKVIVDAGSTLNIEAGTIIKGTAGQGSLASALVIARGGMINANGTENSPIIFTSVSDNIEIGQSSGTNLGPNDQGLWGGVLILGNAPCSFSGDVSELQIEGIPADDTFGLYGGNNPNDNSGSFTYVSIRHGGAVIGADNEINGLTLGGVGNNTIINNVEVVANSDDGIEFFGGTVNANNLLIWASGDDGIDIDQAYSGTISNSVVILGDNSDHALEIDGPEGSLFDSFILNNITLIGNDITENGEYADYRSNAMGSTNNIYAYGFKSNSDVEIDNNGVAINYNSGDLSFGEWQIVIPSGVDNVEDIFINNAESVTISGFGSSAIAISEGANSVGCETSELSWAYSNSKAALGW
ncbi:MAG: hypothetical protein EVA44_02140 [Flavobacteriales bacterium]|nr:MAG: hypothetical protein EVA44_02140 [Flavobacteriales bacterium]